MIKCDECKEEVNHLRTFSFIITGLVGGSIITGMFINKPLFQLLGALLGLTIATKIIYDLNPSHWKHTSQKILKKFVMR